MESLTPPPTVAPAPDVLAEALDAPDVVYLAQRNVWVVRQPYALERDGLRVEVPRAFVCDLASIPRWVWWLIAPFELSEVAPLIHDRLYKTGGRCAEGRRVDRATADRLFLRLMVEEGVPGWRREAAYRAVRTFGGRAWQAAA